MTDECYDSNDFDCNTYRKQSHTEGLRNSFYET